jgi:hypothetical protein
MRREFLMMGFVVITSLTVTAQNGKSPAKSAVDSRNPQLTKTHTEVGNIGERKFQENCSRCHNAPEAFPPRISGTIVRHMRVRASLSEEDAREILRYLNPQ